MMLENPEIFITNSCRQLCTLFPFTTPIFYPLNDKFVMGVMYVSCHICVKVFKELFI